MRQAYEYFQKPSPWRNYSRGKSAPSRLEIIQFLTRRAADAFERSRHVTLLIKEAETRLLAIARERRLYKGAGHVRFNDFCTEVLQLNPRTARRRLKLHGAFERHPALRIAFQEGRVTGSQILAVASVVNDDNAEEWISLAESLPVRALRERVRAARGGAPDDDEDNDEWVPIHFSAPEQVGLLLEHGLETARRVMGWDAPRGECLGAILAEAESSLPTDAELPEPADGDTEDPEDADELSHPRFQPAGRYRGIHVLGKKFGSTSPHSTRPEVEFRCTEHERKLVRKHLRHYERALARAERIAADLHSSDHAASLDSLLATWNKLETLGRPLHVMQARLYFRLLCIHGPLSLGDEDVVHFGCRVLGISDRAVIQLIYMGQTFEYHPAFRRAYIEGRMGAGQIALAAGVKYLGPHATWMKRAEGLTYRQFRRECHFAYRLLEFDQDLRFWLLDHPIQDAEPLLRERLFRLGVSLEVVEREMESRDLVGPQGASRDPAENPLVMSRLEVLLDMAIIARCETASDLDPSIGSRKTLSTPGRHHRVAIQARKHIYEHWKRVLARLRRERGWIPRWAAAVILLAAATEQWQTTHDAFLPTEYRILERDGYRCRAPGCTARRSLEVHHIIYRSHDGPDDAWNLITLCAAHHRHAVHEGSLRIRGKAPHNLTWEVGAPRTGPTWIYNGDRGMVFPWRPSGAMAVS